MPDTVGYSALRNLRLPSALHAWPLMSAIECRLPARWKGYVLYRPQVRVDPSPNLAPSAAGTLKGLHRGRFTSQAD
jgi:hypothetical protein